LHLLWSVFSLFLLMCPSNGQSFAGVSPTMSASVHTAFWEPSQVEHAASASEAEPEAEEARNTGLPICSSMSRGGTSCEATASPQALSRYAASLNDRLQRCKDELLTRSFETQAARRSLDNVQQMSQADLQELELLRTHWDAERPMREAMFERLRVEDRRLAERERRCCEAEAQSRLAQRAEVEELEEAEAGRSRVREREREQKVELAALEEERKRLMGSVSEFKAVAQREGVECARLRERVECLRRETKALRTGADAACQGEDRTHQKILSMEGDAATGQQRQHVLARQVAELQAESQRLALELAGALGHTSTAVTATGSISAATASSDHATNGTHVHRIDCRSDGSVASGDAVAITVDESSHAPSASHEAEDAVWCTNRQLQLKVDRLREELYKRQQQASHIREVLALREARSELRASASDSFTEAVAIDAHTSDGCEAFAGGAEN